MTLPIGQLSEVQRFIIERLGQQPRDVARVTAERFRMTRQAANRQLRQLVSLGVITAEGETRSRRYSFVPLAHHQALFPITPELAEDVVWRQEVAPHLSGAPDNVLDICRYGITEIVNNAIDHSGGGLVLVTVRATAAEIQLGVSDNGVGIFRKIRDRFHLEDERHAVLELSKGKLTTDPDRHTGEGLFFASRMFDTFGLLSGQLYLGHRREGQDWLLEARDNVVEGTHALMAISPLSPHTAKEVFDTYAMSQDDYGFSRTHVVVALAQTETDRLVSRSQAKRLMARLDRFKQIVLDFEGVDSIGPAFADEIFRVFPAQHPQTTITVIKANDEVARMRSRAMHADPTRPPFTPGNDQGDQASSPDACA